MNVQVESFCRKVQARTAKEDDTLILLQHIQEESIKGIIEEGITYDPGLALLSDDQLRYIARNIAKFPERDQQLDNYYYSMVLSAVEKNPLEAENEIKALVEYAKVNVKDETVMMQILAFANVLYNSNQYWGGANSARTTAGPFRIEHAIADASMAQGAAVWGGIAAGPLGAVVMGVNGAIIGSATSYFWGNIPLNNDPGLTFETSDGFLQKLNAHYTGASDIREFAQK